MNRYGHFSADGRQFFVTTPDTPRNWYNYCWNESYNAFFSQVGYGEGLAQGECGLRAKPVTNRAVYLLSENDWWFATAVPDGLKAYDFYECEHALGYSRVTVERAGIRSRLTFFVPREGQLELWALELENRTDREREIKAVGYASTEMDGGYAFQGYNTSEAHFSPAAQAVLLRADQALRQKGKEERIYGYLAADRADSFDCAHTAFIGTYGSVLLPRAVLKGGCTGGECVAEKACFAVQKNLVLPPGGRGFVLFQAGVALDEAEILAQKARFDSLEKIEAEREAVVAQRREETGGAAIQTPLPELDHLFEWLKYETDMGSRWARVRHNGFRDLTSDSECLITFHPALGLERLKNVLSYQYSNGYAPRRFLNGQIQDNHFSDNAVWMTFAARTLLCETGDPALLETPIPFNDGSSASLYEHCRRALDFLYHFQGAHGLIRLWGGDWNDTLDHAGLEGRGESVWLSIAWYKAAREFMELARALNRPQDLDWIRPLMADMREKIDRFGWDGEYYLTAIDDWNHPIGSRLNEEARIFALPNLWALWSGVGIGDKGLRAYEAMEKALDSPLGLKVSAPPFTKADPHIGGMSRKAPGVHENGGVYLHVSTWKIITDALLKRPEAVQKTLYSILPFTNPVVADRCEPYMLFNSYFPEECGYRYGTPGQSWRSATGPCLVKSLLLYVFGLQGEADGLHLRPCLPPDWESCSVQKDFRGAHYDITYLGGGCRIAQIEADGEPLPGDLLPLEAGKSYQITVRMEKNS